MSAHRVLVVDDNESLAETVAGILADEGFAVEVASSGAQALITWRARPAEVVLVDVDLPDIGGIRLARRLASRGGCRLLVMSAHDPRRLVPVCEELGVAFLPKPFTSTRLLKAVRAMASKMHAEAERNASPHRRMLGPREPRGLLQHVRRRSPWPG